MKTKWKLADDGFCFINLVPFLEFHACRNYYSQKVLGQSRRYQPLCFKLQCFCGIKAYLGLKSN
jgi:hypothetical protein